ncbi:MAG: CPBP family intramembrane metalloprotease [Bacteroidales bacterium]|nr:CPBP family intramembrane metalloprotease [Bacteroidales bacterium]
MKENYLIEKKPAIKRGWLRALLFLIAFLILYAVIQGIAVFIIAAVLNIPLSDFETLFTDPNKLGIQFILTSSTLVITILIAWIFMRYVDRKSFISMGFELKGKSKDIIYGFLVGLVLIFLGFVILNLTNFLEVVSIEYSSKIVFGGFFLFVIAAIIEEIVFRGYVLNNLMDSIKNKYIALLISAILFALLHGVNPNLSILGFINLIIAGIALGITYIHTKNLWFPIFLHISWNFFQGPIFGFEVSGSSFNSIIQQKVIGNDIITGGNFGFEGSIIITVLLIGMILTIDQIYRRKKIPSIKSSIN